MPPEPAEGLPLSVLQNLAQRSMAQDWPAGALYVVATPIGNLLDMSLRAWQALMRCDIIAAEDTRATQVLARAWGIDTPFLAAHRHNEAQVAQAIVARLQAGQRVALVSDAGSPAVSDPGARIVRSVREAGLRVVPIPGPSAVIAALMASGATSDENPSFVFAGFAPPRPAARRSWLAQYSACSAPVVIYEAPHRLAGAVDDLLQVAGPQRMLTIARELTKRFEEIVSLPLGEVPGWLAGDRQRLRGEFVLVLHGAAVAPGPDGRADEASRKLAGVLLEQMSVRDVSRVLVRACGLTRDAAYRLALELDSERG